MRIGVHLDEETYRELTRIASAERRPLSWQASLELRKAMGLPAPQPADQNPTPAQ